MKTDPKGFVSIKSQIYFFESILLTREFFFIGYMLL